MSSESPSSSAPPTNLRRGRACTNCRRRKMRCDGVRPTCGKCLAANRPEDCEYMSGQGRSRIQVLEEDISRVEARIYELEHPDQPVSSIQLHDPYTESNSQASATSHHRRVSEGHGLNDSLSNSPSQSSWWTSGEPPSNYAQNLVDTFLVYSSEFGFFLDPSRFRIAALRNAPISHPSRPDVALLIVVYLMGTRLSGLNSSQSHEQVLLSRALHETATALSNSTHPHKIMHALQSEVLLAHYFFSCGRFLEGKYHVSAAISISVSGALNKIRTDRPATSVRSALSPPQDSVEEGERIRACWAVFILDQSWAVALGALPNVAYPTDVPGAQIDTPWPLEIRDYAQGRLPPDFRNSYTIERFLSNTPDNADARISTMAMHAKASIIWQRVYDLSRGWKINMSQQESSAFNASFVSLNTVLDTFKNTLLPPNQLAHATPSMARTLLVAHSITNAAMIELHAIFSQSNPTSRQKRVSAAQTIVGITSAITLRDFAHLNPIMGTIWVSASQVFIDEITLLRSLRPAWAQDVPLDGERNLVSAFERGLTAMSPFSASCPLMRYQLSQIQDAYAAL